MPIVRDIICMIFKNANAYLKSILLRSFYLYISYNIRSPSALFHYFPSYRLYKLYVYILHGAFVALDIFGGAFMDFLHKIRLYIECFNLAGISGLIACYKYLSGGLSLPDLPSESSVFSVGGLDA